MQNGACKIFSFDNVRRFFFDADFLTTLEPKIKKKKHFLVKNAYFFNSSISDSNAVRISWKL